MVFAIAIAKSAWQTTLGLAPDSKRGEGEGKERMVEEKVVGAGAAGPQLLTKARQGRHKPFTQHPSTGLSSGTYLWCFWTGGHFTPPFPSCASIAVNRACHSRSRVSAALGLTPVRLSVSAHSLPPVLHPFSVSQLIETPSHPSNHKSVPFVFLTLDIRRWIYSGILHGDVHYSSGTC